MGPAEVLWDGDGVTPPPERAWDQWKYHGMEMGYPSPLVNKQTPVKNITFPILWMRSINICLH